MSVTNNSAACFATLTSYPLITDKLFSYLTTPDVRTVSRVSKIWNTASRKFLQCRRQCPLIFNKIDISKLENLLELLDNPVLHPNDHPHPFNGISFVFINSNGDLIKEPFNKFGCSEFQNERSGSSQMDQLIELLRQIISRIPFKNLSMRGMGHCSNPVETYPVKLNKYFAVLPCDIVETLNVDNISYLSYQESTARKFPNLKICKINLPIDFQHCTVHSVNLLISFLKACPLLHSWTAEVPSWAVESFVVAKKTVLIKSLTLSTSTSEHYLKIIQNANLMNVQVIKRTNSGPPSCSMADQYFEQIIRSNINNLQAMEVDVELFEHLVNSNLPPMTRVTKLHLSNLSNNRVNFWRPGPIEIRIRRLFPQAQCIKINLNGDSW